MSEHPKLPDIVAAMKWLDAFDSCVYSGPEWAAEHARTIKAEIERLRSPAPAEGKVLEAAHRVRNCDYGMVDEGDARMVAVALISRRSPAPADDGEGLREALVLIEIIAASGRTDELLAKMKTINSLAHSALSNSISQGEK